MKRLCLSILALASILIAGNIGRAAPQIFSSHEQARSVLESERRNFKEGKSDISVVLALAEQWRDAALQTNFANFQCVMLTLHDYLTVLREIERDVVCNIEDGIIAPSAGMHIRKLCESAEVDFRNAISQDRIEIGRERQRWAAELAKRRARTIGPTDLIYPTRPPRKVPTRWAPRN